MNINEFIDKYIELGYSYANAQAKICQDLILLGIFNSKFKNHITIKGGVVLHNISNNIRRATRDLDLDFIKYSLEDESIKEFIKTINKGIKGINIEVQGDIKKLHHQDYNGKRAFIKITDNYNNSIVTKLDIGVEKNFDIEQDEYYFNLDVIGGNAKLLINSKEQIFTEKLKSLLKLGFNSTRYKDLFDFYYLINEAQLDIKKLNLCLNNIIFLDNKTKETNINDIIKRLNAIFNDSAYLEKLSSPQNNWLDITVDKAIDNLLTFLQSLNKVAV